MRTLSYWVFTSGEEGVHGLDWGIKYASPVLGAPHDLDGRYRALLSEFSLPPNLERPDDGVGLLLLPWQSGTLLGFVFPGQDLKGRLNTIAILCVVPVNLRGSFSLREIARRIWSCNDLTGISRRGASRPESLVIDDGPAPSESYPFMFSSALMDWPTQEKGYFSINRSIRELARTLSHKNEETLADTRSPRESTAQETPKVRRSWKGICLVVACLAVGVYATYSLTSSDETPKPSPVSQEEVKEQPEPKGNINNHSDTGETTGPAPVEHDRPERSNVIEDFLYSMGNSSLALEFYNAGALASVDIVTRTDNDYFKKMGFIPYDDKDKEQYVRLDKEALRDWLRSFNNWDTQRITTRYNVKTLSFNSEHRELADTDRKDLVKAKQFFAFVKEDLMEKVFHPLAISPLKCDGEVPELEAEAASLGLYFKTRDDGIFLVAVGQRSGSFRYYLDLTKDPIVKRDDFIGHMRTQMDEADGTGLMGQLWPDNRALMLYFLEGDDQLEDKVINGGEELNKILDLFISQLLQRWAFLPIGGGL